IRPRGDCGVRRLLIRHAAAASRDGHCAVNATVLNIELQKRIGRAQKKLGRKRKMPGQKARQVKQGGFTSGRRRIRRPHPSLAPEFIMEPRVPKLYVGPDSTNATSHLPDRL